MVESMKWVENEASLYFDHLSDIPVNQIKIDEKIIQNFEKTFNGFIIKDITLE